MYEKTTLGNGLRIVSSYVPHTRSASVNVLAGIGSRYESDREAGVSHYLEHMLFKGTERRPSSTAISGAIEELGGIMNGGTDRETTSFWCKVAQPHFPHALDVMLDFVRNPLMDPEEVERERGVVQEELSMTNDYPSFRVDMLTDEMLWPNHPMGRDTGGSHESVNGITREMLIDWFRRHYVASNMVVSVAGNFTHQQVLEAVGPLVEDWPQGTQPRYTPVEHDPSNCPNVRVENRRTEQAHVGLSLLGLPTRHEDRYALDMMNSVLGDGMSSRLFVEVREKRGLAYDIHSSASHFRDTGSIVVYCGVEPKKAREAVKTVLGEMERIKKDVPEGELCRAKEFAKGRMLLRMEDTRAIAAWGGTQEILYDEIIPVDDVIREVDAISADDVVRAANLYLRGDWLNLAVVGPFRGDKQFQALLRG